MKTHWVSVFAHARVSEKRPDKYKNKAECRGIRAARWGREAMPAMAE